ncbi:hypothetical protein GQ457_03G024870 [Hibiscus cannabinus]
MKQIRTTRSNANHSRLAKQGHKRFEIEQGRSPENKFLAETCVMVGCKEAVLGLHHMRQKNHLHFKECMIQRLCENSMPARKRFSRRLKDHVFRDTHTQKAM